MLQTILGAWFPSSAPTAAEVHTVSVSGLQQRPVIWEAYVRGWQGCVACMPPPPMPRASALVTWPALPVFRALVPRQLPPRQPPTPHQPMPARSAGMTKTRPKVQLTANSTPSKAIDTVSAAKRKSMEYLSKCRQVKRQTMRQQIRESQGTTSQQFHLAKHGETLDSPRPSRPLVHLHRKYRRLHRGVRSDPWRQRSSQPPGIN